MWNTNQPSPNAPLTDSMVSDAEQELGVRFPASYLDALRIKNGGSVVGDLVRLPHQVIPQHLRHFVDHGYVSVRGVNGIGSSNTSVLGSASLIAEWGLPERLVILDGDGHWWIAFDYRGTDDNPPIVFVDSDSGDTLHVTESFAEFFGSFVADEDMYDEDGNFIG